MRISVALRGRERLAALLNNLLHRSAQGSEKRAVSYTHLTLPTIYSV